MNRQAVAAGTGTARSSAARTGGTRTGGTRTVSLRAAWPSAWRAAVATLAVATALVAAPPRAAAQLGVLARQSAAGSSAPRPPQVDENETVDPASPRAAMRAYLRAARRGDWAEAATWLGAPVGERERLPELARRLKAVLDRHLEIRLDKLSARAAGDTTDRLAPDREDLGLIPSADLGAQSVRLLRVDTPTPHWEFSPRTVEHVDTWYDELEDKWLRERLPDWFFLSGPWQVLWWQWIALLVLLPVSLGLARLVRPLLGWLLRLVPAWRGDEGTELLHQLGTPTLFLLALVGYRIAISPLLLMAASNRAITMAIGALVIAAVTWWTLRAVTLVARLLPLSEWAGGRPSVRSTIQLGTRVAKVLIVIVAVIGALADLGYPVGTLLAGLGIGGIAVALGAQKTLEHFFGSVSLGLDQPFRVGDWVKIEDFEGEVESIGLRSTRIRTLERTVVSLPNGKLSEMRTENFAGRDRIRFHQLIPVDYAATLAQLREVREACERALRASDKVWPGRVVVRIRELGPSAILLEVMAWYAGTDVDEFRAWREATLLDFLEQFAAHGVRIAPPVALLGAAAVAPDATLPTAAGSPSRG
ncbi:MAG: mechanosensitive ion channel family protein [Gemmatimonadetes bacterium]|nr:mechanosensitive ion channel family protein [Gemmatimonadota bacterium]